MVEQGARKGEEAQMRPSPPSKSDAADPLGKAPVSRLSCDQEMLRRARSDRFTRDFADDFVPCVCSRLSVGRNGYRPTEKNAVVVPRCPTWALDLHSRPSLPCSPPHCISAGGGQRKCAALRKIKSAEQVVNCTCGKSNNLPFCDNSHRLPWSVFSDAPCFGLSCALSATPRSMARADMPFAS